MAHDDISDAEIEAGAREIAKWVGADPERWRAFSEPGRAAILASRAALLIEGRKVVAREPAAAMADAKTGFGSAYANYKVWTAMWDAA